MVYCGWMLWCRFPYFVSSLLPFLFHTEYVAINKTARWYRGGFAAPRFSISLSLSLSHTHSFASHSPTVELRWTHSIPSRNNRLFTYLVHRHTCLFARLHFPSFSQGHKSASLRLFGYLSLSHSLFLSISHGIAAKPHAVPLKQSAKQKQYF